MRDEMDQSEPEGVENPTGRFTDVELMDPPTTLIVIGSAAALLAVVAVAGSAAVYPSVPAADRGLAWVIAAVVAAVLMLLICLLQLILWRRNGATGSEQHDQDFARASQLSWAAHLVSYVVALVVMISCMTASADADWSSLAALLLGLGLVLSLLGQVLAAVQYLRPGGPPGTVPTHLRRLRELSERRVDRSPDPEGVFDAPADERG